MAEKSTSVAEKSRLEIHQSVVTILRDHPGLCLPTLLASFCIKVLLRNAFASSDIGIGIRNVSFAALKQIRIQTLHVTVHG
jgi:hypothetical protein